MSQVAFEQVVERVRIDSAFRARLQRDPVRALAVYELTADEFTSLRPAQPASGEAHDDHRRTAHSTSRPGHPAAPTSRSALVRGR
jgi:hypothetical protein